MPPPRWGASTCPLIRGTKDQDGICQKVEVFLPSVVKAHMPDVDYMVDYCFEYKTSTQYIKSSHKVFTST